MVYEAHLTVRGTTDIVQWLRECHNLGAKPIIIQLSRGDFPLQIMLGAEGDSSHVAQELHLLTKKHGFDVVRRKLEKPLSVRDITARYYECHIKLHFKPGSTIVPLEIGGLKRSRNLITGTWFLTRRMYGIHPATARERFEADTEEVMRAYPQAHVSAELESVLEDTAEWMDDGWVN